MDQERFAKQIEWAIGRYDCNVPVRDAREKALATLEKPGQWRKVEAPERIVNRLRSRGQLALADQLLAEGKTLDASQDLNFLERIIGATDFLDARFLPMGARIRGSVGRVVDKGANFGFGTGFMIAPRLMMTNNHVLPQVNDATNSALEFDFLREMAGNLAVTTIHELDPDLLFITDEELDFTIVGVTSTSINGKSLDRGWSPLIAESGKALISERVNIIQHPDGNPQQLALRDNRIVDIPGDFLHYRADTQPRSSDSPVYNDQWQLTALHHSGVLERNGQQQILLTDGSIWTGDPNRVKDISWIANEGVRISAIASHLNAFAIPSLSQDQQELLMNAFSPLDPVDFTDEGAEPNGPPVEPGQGSPVFTSDGTSHWTIPLNISVDLGPLPGALPIQNTTEPSKPTPRKRNQSNENIAQERLNRFKNRPYYDEAADLENAETYYQNTPASASEEEWYALFRDLVSSTHSNQLTYKRARLDFLYPWVDLHENDSGTRVLRSVYSGKDFNPLDVVSQEILNEQKRLQVIAELRHGNVALTEERLETQLELLEAKFPFNCEHVVPQSWFRKADPMKSDLHHPSTCEWGCNSFRSNIPYFDHDDYMEAVRSECGKRTDDGFEPEVGKGVVARATLYFLLRYPGLIGDQTRELQVEQLETLLKWHN